MELRENLLSETTWDIYETSFEPEQIVASGSNFMTGNGYLGYRGTFASSRKEDYVACVVTDTYDMADGTWKELVNAPNPLYRSVIVAGEELRPYLAPEYRRGLEFRQGRFSVSGRFPGAPVEEYLEQRFASYANIHGIPARLELSGTPGGEVTLRCGIDGDVWSLNGEHFRSYTPYSREDRLFLETVTAQHGVTVVSSVSHKLVRGELIEEREIIADREIYREMICRLDEEGVLVLESYAVLFSSKDVEDPVAAATALMKELEHSGYQDALAAHREAWDTMWEDYDVEIEGDPLSGTLMRYNTYHNVIATPAHSDHLPIGARGLSCQAYQGAAFWDQEIFNLPMFLYTRPEIARNILRYRYKTIAGARKKARDLGYHGAFYAWVSGDTGEEICPSYFFIDVLSGRRIRNHFNDWQIHISPDISYTVAKYLEVTGDWDFLREGGAEILMEVARFIYSRVHYSPARDRYEILRVLGPDEYHENVDNNAFTNFQCRFALNYALHARTRLPEKELEELDRKLELTEDELGVWKQIAEKLYIPGPREEDALIEQFDGFFDHEDITPRELEKRLKDPGEYWGWPNGIAVETQVSKQADVTQLFMLHPDAYETETMRRNWEYYEARTQHGSSLSHSVYAITASWVGHLREAYDYFIRSSTVDLFNTGKAVSGGTFIGGIHTAACGAAWQIITLGFARMRVDEEGIALDPRLPEQWSRLSFSLTFRGSRVRVEITPEEVTLVCDPGNSRDVPIKLPGSSASLAPGERLTRPRT
ncbi:MAG: glycoside hydrolase family 65 protein [Spirochaetaceae bacterium]